MAVPCERPRTWESVLFLISYWLQESFQAAAIESIAIEMDISVSSHR